VSVFQHVLLSAGIKGHAPAAAAGGAGAAAGAGDDKAAKKDKEDNHLRNFFLLLPALTINYVENLRAAKDRMEVSPSLVTHNSRVIPTMRRALHTAENGQGYGSVLHG
jgi:hypothetical protein